MTGVSVLDEHRGKRQTVNSDGRLLRAGKLVGQRALGPEGVL